MGESQLPPTLGMPRADHFAHTQALHDHLWSRCSSQMGREDSWAGVSKASQRQRTLTQSQIPLRLHPLSLPQTQLTYEQAIFNYSRMF